MTVPENDRPASEVLAALRQRYPDSPFLALGQTVFWDEPMKAVLHRLLDENHLGGQMILGVHDTDYFAKTTVLRGETGRFALLPHNDGTTRDLWSAAGEISTLFGSETFPSRHDYVRNGVAFEKIARAHPGGRQAFLDAMTEAWGWRGLVYTGSRDLIVHKLPLKEVGDGILEMLSWGFENALTQIGPGCCHGEARQVADTILGWCREYRDSNPDKALTHLFQYLLPRLYSLLLGSEPDNVTVDCTAHLLGLTPETASLPRFRFVELFLNPETRPIAEKAYNQAVAGSTIYTLDRFGAGAIPFDLVLPEQGRGTIRVTPRVLFVETRQPVAIGLKEPITNLRQMAEILTRKFGDHVTLVGKAVSLVSMLAQEFIFVFNEEGSMYVSRTRQMNDTLRQHGISLDMRPILRMEYQTWDSLSVGRSSLVLNEYLASAFGQQTITTPEFAANWRQVIVEQQQLCAEMSALRKPLALLDYLRERDPATSWEERRAVYLDANATLLQLRDQVTEIQREVRTSYERLRHLKEQGQALQQEQGTHFRSVEEWTPQEEAKRAEFTSRLQEVEKEKRSLRHTLRSLRDRRWQIERGTQAMEARATLRQIETEAEEARLRLVRNALLTIAGLPHTNHRPSVWWLPMIDASGRWFRRIVETTRIYTEPLLTEN